MNSDLKGNGFVFNLYHYLWLSDQLTKEVPNVNIAETIQFRLGVPRCWYFSRNGQVLRKNKTQLNIDSIIPQFISNKNDTSTITAIWISRDEEEQRVYFDYMNQCQLNEFLTKKINYETNGYLQRFIYPKGVQNSVIKCIWSPNLCIYEGYQNKHHIHDVKADIVQRAVTFEYASGPVEIFSIKGKALPQKMELLNFTIAKHVNNVTQSAKKIIGMENYFKINSEGELVLIFCDSLKVRTRKRDVEVEISEKRPSISLSPSVSKALLNFYKPILFSKTMACLGCGKTKNQIEFYDISNRDLIESWEQNHFNNEDAQIQQCQQYIIDSIIRLEKKKKQIEIKQNISKIDSKLEEFFNSFQKQKTSVVDKKYLGSVKLKIQQNYWIPSIFRAMYPKMCEDEYQTLKKHEGFLSDKIQLCEVCYQEKIKECRLYETVEGLSKLWKARDNKKHIDLQLRQSKSKLLTRTEENEEPSEVKEKWVVKSKSQLLFRQKSNVLQKLISKVYGEQQVGQRVSDSLSVAKQASKTQIIKGRKRKTLNVRQIYSTQISEQ